MLRTSFTCGKISLLILFYFTASTLFAQGKFLIVGKVSDAKTGEGIPFATVSLKGKTIGTLTDFEGKYRLLTHEISDSLLVSSVGYQAKRTLLTTHPEQTIHVELSEDHHRLQEVVIRGRGRNPAYAILRRVQEHKSQNDFARLKGYQWEAYNRINVSVGNVSEKFKRNKIIRQIYDKLARMDSSRTSKGNLAIPIHASEAISTVYFRSNPARMKEVIQKRYAKGLGIADDDFISQLTASGYNTINFYQNWIGLFRKEFISPLAEGGNDFYKYRLKDTVQIGQSRCYQIEFNPRNTHDLAFHGTLAIDTASYALVQIDASLAKTANINFIKTIHIQQEHQRMGPQADTWIPNRTRVTIDATELFDASTGIVASLNVDLRNVLPNEVKGMDFFDTPIEITENSKTTDEPFWQGQRQKVLSPEERISLTLIDTVSQVPSFKRIAKVVDFFSNGGYVHLSPAIDFGSAFFSYALNNVEQHRIWAGIRLRPGFSKNWSIRAHVSYGTNDRKFKPGLEIAFTPTTAPLTRLGFKADFDIDQIGIRQADIGDNPLFRLASRFGTLNGAFYQRDAQLFLQRDFFQSLSSTVAIRHRQFYPLYHFHPERFSENQFSVLTPFSAPEASLSLRYVPNRVPSRNPNRIRIQAGKTSPNIGFTYVFGHVQDKLLEPYEKRLGDYHIFKADFSHVVRLGILGKTAYTIEGFYTPSLLPVNLLNVHLGNETIFYVKNAFNLMRYAEFASDRYLALSLHHSFEGLLTNRVPLLNRWKLRTFATGKVLVGSLKPENEQLVAKYLPSDGLSVSQIYVPKSLGTTPYLEIGYGVDNIFRFLRIVAVHRLSHLGGNGIKSFGIRASVNISL